MSKNDENRSSNDKQTIPSKNDETAKQYPLIEPYRYHVFLSHNSKDKPEIRRLKETLESEGILCWYDEDELQPGIPWQPLLEGGIRQSKSVIVAVAVTGLGPWENEEMQAALQLAVREKRAVILLLLPGAPSIPDELPMFLGNRTWVDLRQGYTSSGIQKLLWGITGQKAKVNNEEKQPLIAQPTFEESQKSNVNKIEKHDKNPPTPLGCSFNLKIVVMCLLATVLLSFPIWVLNQPSTSPAVLEQWNLEEVLATQVAADLHDNQSVAKSQLYIGKRGRFTFELTSAAAKDFIGRSFNLPFNTDPTSITIEVNIAGQFDTDKFEAFDGSVVNVKGTVSKIEKVSNMRATIYLENAEFTDLPPKR